MSTFRFHISMSLDGYVAGPDQGPEDPLGRGRRALHDWVGSTRTFQSMEGVQGRGETGIDDDHFAAVAANVGAHFVGRNMFGPFRGPCENEEWQGSWGPDPRYHQGVFVLTSHASPVLVMGCGTTFHVVTEGIEAALAAAGKPLTVWMYCSPAAPTLLSNTCEHDYSVRSSSMSPRYSSVPARACSTDSATARSATSTSARSAHRCTPLVANLRPGRVRRVDRCVSARREPSDLACKSRDYEEL